MSRRAGQTKGHNVAHKILEEKAAAVGDSITSC